MAVFVVLILALVIGQTWWDWRDVQRTSRLPQWASGLAVAGMVASALAGATSSMGAMFYQHTVSELQSGFGAGMFWAESAFLLCGMGVIVAAVRKKSVRSLLLVAGVLSFAVWLGISLYA